MSIIGFFVILGIQYLFIRFCSLNKAKGMVIAIKLRKKLTIIMILLILSSLSVISIFVYFKSSNTITNQTEQSALQYVKSERDIISGLINQEIIEPNYLAATKEVNDLLVNQNDNSRRELVFNLITKYFSGKTNLESVALINEKGFDVCDTNPKSVYNIS